MSYFNHKLPGCAERSDKILHVEKPGSRDDFSYHLAPKRLEKPDDMRCIVRVSPGYRQSQMPVLQRLTID